MIKGWGRQQHKNAGFTLTELAVIIVVIGILASIGTFAYLNVTRANRDVERRTDASTIATSLQAWARENNQHPINTGGGAAGGGSGWVHSDSYAQNIQTVLLEAEVLDNPVEAPRAPDGTNGLAFFPCHDSSDNQFYGVFAQLEDPNDSDDETINRWNEGENGTACITTPLDAPYSMNYVETFHFRL